MGDMPGKYSCTVNKELYRVMHKVSTQYMVDCGEKVNGNPKKVQLPL